MIGALVKKGRGRSSEAMRMTSYAVQLVRKSVHEGGAGPASALAFSSRSGRAHTDALPGIAEIWLTPAGIERVRLRELARIGTKIGTRPSRA